MMATLEDKPAAAGFNTILLDEDDAPILTLVANCQSNFEGAIKHMKENGERKEENVLQKLQTKFIDWTGYLGVFALGNGSLDQRLKRHLQYRDLVLLALDMLNMNLLQITAGLDSSSSDDSLEDDAGLRIAELDGIKKAINELDRLAIYIRLSSTSSLDARVKSFGARKASDISSFEKIATLAVNGLYAEASDDLRSNLSKSMVAQHTRLLYWKSHDRKLRAERRRDRPSHDNPGMTQINSTSSPAIEMPQGELSMKDSAPNPPQPEKIRAAFTSTMLSETVPSNTGSHLRALLAEGGMPIPRRTSASTVIKSNAKFPNPPQFEDWEDRKPCPLCRKVFPKTDFNDTSWWRCHVNEDLSPFTCILSTCFESPTYARRSEWTSHTDRDHGTFWSRSPRKPDRGICPLCCMTLEDPGDAHIDIERSTTMIVPQDSSNLSGKPQSDLGKVESKTASTNSRRKKKTVQFAIAREDSQPTTQAIDRVTGTVQADDCAAQKLYSAMMLNHIADHLQFLSLLTLRLSMERLAVGNVQAFSSSQAISSDGTPAKRSSLDDEFDRPEGSNVEETDTNRILEESFYPEAERMMGWERQSTTDEFRKDETEEAAPIDWNLFSGLKDAVTEEKDSVIARMQEVRVKEYDKLMEVALNSFLDGTFPNLPAKAEDALDRIEAKVRSEFMFDAVIPISGQEKTIRRDDLHDIFDGLFSSINGERDGVVDYCTDQVWTARPYQNPQQPAEEKLASRRNLFAILVIRKCPLNILRFVKEGISDIDIPLSTSTLRKCFPTWIDSDVVSFLEFQNQYFSPHLEVSEPPTAPLQTKILNFNDYKIGWICALATEFFAAQVFLDEQHELPDILSPQDNNVYILGRIGRNNVVIAALPDGEYGLTSAASVARDMLHSFPNVRICLMVGIAGGVPSKKHDIRLGDVVVGHSSNSEGPVFQYDYGESMQNLKFQCKNFLGQPPRILRNAVNSVISQHEMDGHQFQDIINSILETKPRLRRKYQRPHPETDRLYRSNISHPPASDEHCAETCGDDGSSLIIRKQRANDEDDPTVHYGLIAFSRRLMKDGLIRDYLADMEGVLCFDMDAARLMNHFPCLVIRGICDYSDSHKNNVWQGYAAMTASAYAKDVIGPITPDLVEAEKRIIDIFPRMSNETLNLVQMQHGQSEIAILNWLTPVDYGPQQSENLRRHFRGTGEWVLDSYQFQNWLKNENQTLFCPGVPGAGKTFLTSIVIDHIQSILPDQPGIGIAYIYSDFRRRAELTIDDLLASVLKQLAGAQFLLPSAVRGLYHKYNVKRTRPSASELGKAILSVAMLYSRVFILIDALDVWRSATYSWLEVLSTIFSLRSNARANLFVTSRSIPEITKWFRPASTLEIRASNEDIRRYLSGNIHQLPGFVHDNPGLEDIIITGILHAAQGVFLLARLHLMSLKRKSTIRENTNALQNLREHCIYEGLYDETMERIASQFKEQSQLAMSVLSWITYAKRPLTITELQHALGVEPGASVFDEENLSDVEIIVSVCAGLITIDEHSNTVRFVHYSVQEYFKKTRKKWFPEYPTRITVICMTYLLYEVFGTGACYTEDALVARLESYPFYSYASRYWGDHVREDSSITDQLMEYLENDAKIDSSCQAWHYEEQRAGQCSYAGNYPQQMTGLHLVAWYGLVKGAAQLLLDGGANIEATNSYHETPLHTAAKSGREAVAQLLLERGANIKTRSLYNKTPLHIAAESGHKAVIQLLLDQGADIEAINMYNETPLHIAAKSGHEAVVRLLLDQGANIDATNGYHETPLYIAAKSDHEAVVRLLLDRGANIKIRSPSYKTLLHMAAKSGHEDVVLQLLDRGANIEATNPSHETPLHMAVKNGHEAVVEVLLDRGANIEATRKLSQTPLHMAAESGHEAIVQLLLDRGANIEGNRYSEPPLYKAVKSGHEAIVRLLLDRGANIQTRSLYDKTPLHIAAESGHEAVVRLLLDQGADIEAINIYNETPLHIAAKSGHEVVVQLLLDRGANIEATSKSSQTPLRMAVDKGHDAIVQLLLKKGANT